MNVVFLNSFTFLTHEVIHALERYPGIRLITVSIPERIPVEAVDEVFSQFRQHLPAIVLSINDAGYDRNGQMGRRITSTGSIQANWYHDDPTYEEIILGRKRPDLSHRIDFVTEDSFVPALRSQGRRAFFLPLAVDPHYFHARGDVSFERDVAFVGNSSLEFIEGLLEGDTGSELERFGSLIQHLRRLYEADPGVDLVHFLTENAHLWRNDISMDPTRFIFTVVWVVGYFHRRDFVVGLARSLGGRFTCFGDGYWSRFIDNAQVSPDACYYTTLCHCYRSTKVNININRIQIRTSFTQRVFDCLASGAFLLTDRREKNSQFFATSGINRELVEFDSLQHCLELIEYFIRHEDERLAIARSGMQRVLNEHTYDHRLGELFRTVREQFGV